MRRLLLSTGLLMLAWTGCSSGSTSVGDIKKQDHTGVVVPDSTTVLPDEETGHIEAFDIATSEEANAPSACTTGTDCPTGVCIAAPGGGKQCAVSCTDAPCPHGFECRAVLAGGADVTLVCLPQVDRLCRPCQYNEDCRPEGLDTGDMCVDMGPSGFFCGTDCSTTGSCSEGYACRQVKVVGGDTRMQCVRDEGECQCSPAFIQAGYKTTCYVENQFGRCTGERRCTENGLSPCSAAEPLPEVCDGQDQNCDGQTDNGIEPTECEKTFGDKVCKGPNVCEGGKLVCKAQEPSTEICDGIDNDCNGTTDPEGVEGCVKFYEDDDQDSYGTGEPRCLCKAEGKYAAMVPGDCDDKDPNVNPAANEVCNMRDDDCDGETDEPNATGCTTYFKDHDGDGYGVPGDQKCLCAAMGEYQALEANDCDDNNASVHKGVKERCNGVDDDCNGVPDDGAEDCVMYFYDNDNDGWGVATNQKCLCGPDGKYTATKSGDCDDNNPAISGGQPEVCDGKDNDCDGQTDEDATDCKVFFADKDGDGFGDAQDMACLCQPKSPYVATKAGDCNDADKAQNPSAPEACNNVDDNCNSLIDEGDGGAGCTNYFYDGDQDGYATAGNSKCLCHPDAASKYTTKQTGDCNDNDPSVYPGALEVCDGRDNNCDSATDEGENGPGCHKFYYDNDGDGYGVSQNYKCYCKATGKYSTEKSGDCNDSSPTVSPAASEVCNNQDDNCNGEIDETFPCRTGESQQQACSKCGTQSRTCSNCAWGPWGSCMNQGECEKGDSASCPDACGTMVCSSTCTWGACSYKLDSYEPNENHSQAKYLGTMDDDHQSKSLSTAWLHSSDDKDRFYVSVVENGGLDWTMKFSASLSGVTGYHSLCVFYDRGCNGGVDHQKCATGSGALSVETDNLDGYGSNDDGCVDIEVQGQASCSPYSLQLSLNP